VFVRLWKSLPRLRRPDTLAPWLVTTAKRLAWRVRARTRSREAREKTTAKSEVDPASDPSVSSAALEEEQAVRRALGSIGERCRRLLRALYFESASSSYDDVAERLGIPRGSIGPTRQRCLERLREELERLGFPGAGVSPDPPAGST
jgi:RNA polymerase sigma factor (sigma-70 family)